MPSTPSNPAASFQSPLDASSRTPMASFSVVDCPTLSRLTKEETASLYAVPDGRRHELGPAVTGGWGWGIVGHRLREIVAVCCWPCFSAVHSFGWGRQMDLLRSRKAGGKGRYGWRSRREKRGRSWKRCKPLGSALAPTTTSCSAARKGSAGGDGRDVSRVDEAGRSFLSTGG